ncbi:MAG TPA: filamentous hemagglutinin N-terminal domain-containing protein, partial [Opitutus sp.]|nr:filamentous hemagglutinin N-terminal domain-containing protein [Opitutus sp.]
MKSLVLFVLTALAGASSRAQPVGGRVVAGSAVIGGGGNSTTITQSSDRAIIDWRDFSSRLGDTVRFIQQDAASATLNRVISDAPSSLAGALEANGRIFLINPNGVLIGAGARIDTAGFVASTLDVTNQEFLAGGDLHFSGDSAAAVVNLGAIDAAQGDVFLIARQVENKGAVTAANGTAGLAGGSEVLLTTGGDERLFVQAASSPGTVVNTGTLHAAAAELKAAGGNAYALAINNSGLVRATGSAERDGQIWLVASDESLVTNSGTLDASSADGQGGRIVATGGRVLVDDGAHIDASGATGGGKIEVGGGWHGADSAVANASAVVVRAGANLDASATKSGDGGTVVLWSQDYTNFLGHIAATGGAVSGRGGAVETSSHGNLQAAGIVDTGGTGQWLLDPWDVTIADSGATGTAFADTFEPTADSVILASSINASLDSGTDVAITTGTTGPTHGSINVNAPISWSANSTLTLSAYIDVRVNQPITATGDTAGLVITPNNPSNPYGGTFSLNNRASITLSGATPSLTISGQSYTVINHLGAEGDATSAPGTPTLQGIAAAGNLAGHYALGSDIDASDTANWNTVNFSPEGFTPIGTAAQPFSGTLEGLGHAITGLAITRTTTDNVGLFGYININANINRVGLVDAFVIGETSVGGLAGYNDHGNITMSYVGGTVGGSGHFAVAHKVGGLVGTNDDGVITDTYSSASVNGVDDVGGLVGFNHAGWIENSYATGDVSGQTNVGGLVGASDAYAPIESVGTIQYVYATGNVSGVTNVGGLVGENQDTGIIEAYATGSVSGTTNLGGLVGDNEQTKPELTSPSIGIYSSYWNTETTGQAAAVGLENGQTQYSAGLTSAQMVQKDSFAAFNLITNVGGDNNYRWRIYEGSTTPWLMVFLYPTTITANSSTKTYDGVPYAGSGITQSLASPNPAYSGTLTYGGTAAGAVNVGSYTVSLSGLYSVQQGYNIDLVDGTLTINKADLTLTGSRGYNGATAFAGSFLTATGANGETFTVTGGGAVGNLGTKDVQTN